MKKFLLFICFGFTLFAKAEEKNLPVPLIEQEIFYHPSEASEVYLVWGINNWSIPESVSRPEGSFIKDNLVYTPMKKVRGGFSAKLKLQPNTLVDYVFWISHGVAGKPVDLWDVNTAPQKDYHSLCLNNNTVVISSRMQARPKEAISILDFGIPLMSIMTTLLMLFLIVHKNNIRERGIHVSYPAIIISSTIVLFFFFALIRSSVTGQCWDLYLHPFLFFPRIIYAAYYDIAYLIILATVFLLLGKIFRNRIKIRKTLCISFLSVMGLSLIAAILNIRVVETIGKPFNYPWFYYSDFLKSADAQAAVSSNISSEYILQILMVFVSVIFATIAMIVFADILSEKFKYKKVMEPAIACSSILYLFTAGSAVSHYNWEYDKLANPVVAFIGSTTAFSGNPELFTMNVPDSLKFNLPVPKSKHTIFPGGNKIKNVILFVMESTPAEYIQPYATDYNITPELVKHLNEAIVFEKIYAHAPATNNSMVSILGSVYPWLSYNSITKEHPDIVIPTISSELKTHGYRTAFFNSADNRFQKAGTFLSNRKFDEIKDCTTLDCAGFEVKDEHWDFLNGKDDQCTGDDMFSWITADPQKPFFAMMWTYQTHYPYFASGEEIKYNTLDPVFNRYLNAVHHSDIVLGKLLDGLKQNGLSESTLVVIVGDHGEAFGRHHQTTHASGIYEENLHVPFILINPAFQGEHKTGVGGLVDIAPTIMNILGFDPAEKWQGKDLFTATEKDRVYFFTPWADYLFGYREGDKKYIFNATKNLTEMYDLKKDPHETNNLASQFPEQSEISHQRIAGWVQSSNKFMNSLITPENK